MILNLTIGEVLRSLTVYLQNLALLHNHVHTSYSNINVS